MVDDLVGHEPPHDVLRCDLGALPGRGGAVGRGDGRERVVEPARPRGVGDCHAAQLVSEQPEHVGVALLRVRPSGFGNWFRSMAGMHSERT